MSSANKEYSTKLRTVPEIGSPLCGGFYGGEVLVNNTPSAVIWAPRQQGQSRGRWLEKYQPEFNGAPNNTDSMANTEDMASAGSLIARWALSLDINGFQDWCIPAHECLDLAYRYFKPGKTKTAVKISDLSYSEISQTSLAHFQTGGTEFFDECHYWTSTAIGRDSGFLARAQVFSHGGQVYAHPSASLSVRAVRMVPWLEITQ